MVLCLAFGTSLLISSLNKTFFSAVVISHFFHSLDTLGYGEFSLSCGIHLIHFFSDAVTAVFFQEIIFFHRLEIRRNFVLRKQTIRSRERVEYIFDRTKRNPAERSNALMLDKLFSHFGIVDKHIGVIRKFTVNLCKHLLCKRQVTYHNHGIVLDKSVHRHLKCLCKIITGHNTLAADRTRLVFVCGTFCSLENIIVGSVFCGSVDNVRRNGNTLVKGEAFIGVELCVRAVDITADSFIVFVLLYLNTKRHIIFCHARSADNHHCDGLFVL